MSSDMSSLQQVRAHTILPDIYLAQHYRTVKPYTGKHSSMKHHEVQKAKPQRNQINSGLPTDKKRECKIALSAALDGRKRV
jgi:hypothetical protein